MAAAAPCLNWRDKENTETFVLEQDEILIGRGEGAGLILRHPEVSRRHARLSRDEQGIELIDLESTHGTWVNGERVRSRRLEHGDRIRFGPGSPEMTFRRAGRHPRSLRGR